MKASYKAALLSALVFPGVGQLYLKKYWRGLIILFFVVAALGYLIWSATVSAMNRLDDVMLKMQGGTATPPVLTNIDGSKLLTAVPYYDAVFSFICFLWILAILDAYRIGKQRDLQDEGCPK